jgi:flagellin-like hook-associated protein FlgL
MAQASISLTASMRSNLSSLKTIQSQMDKTQEKLSTGKKVNSAIDNASSYYQARSLTNRAADLDSLLDGMGQGIQTIQAANEGIEAVTAFVDQLKSVATSASALDAEADGYADELEKYQNQYNAILTEIATIAKDSGYQGVNLLQDNKLTVMFNESRSHSLVIQGQDITAGMATAADANAAAGFAWNTDTGVGEAAWANAADVNEALDAIVDVTNYLRGYATELGNNFSIIQTRQDFTESLIDVLETGADNLVLADMNEESANYLALQTRQQLAVNSLSLASQSAQSVLKLF